MYFKNPGRIKIFLKDPNKKNLFKMCKEVLVLWMIKKEMPLYYFKYLYRRDVKNYRDFLGTKQGRKIHASTILHKEEYTSILNNKLNFALYCERNAIPTPALTGYNFGKIFFYKDRLRQVETLQALLHFYNDFFETFDEQALFFRPLSLLGGSGCFKLDRKNYVEQLRSHYVNILNGDYTHTAVIEQHSEINRMYDKSINTIRIMTHFDNGKVSIITSFFRIGAGGSIVDNGSSGGLSVGINPESCTLKKFSYLDMEFGGGELENHPDTGLRFEGFKIPFYKQACELVKRAAVQIPNGLVGWDVAIAPTGPTLIEGNENPSLFVCDVLYGGLLKNPEMVQLLKRIS